jgi:hypothetical protein
MERQVWLAERRAALVAAYDAEAVTYGDGPQPWDVQRAWVARVLGLIPPSPLPAAPPARLRQHHETVRYRQTLVSWLLRDRLGQADQNDLIWAG